MSVHIRKCIGTEWFITHDYTSPKTKVYEYLFDDAGNLITCKNKKEAIELLHSNGITDLKKIDFPAVKVSDSRFTLFVKKWARIFIKADMSQWNDVIDAYETEYHSRAKKDEKFRLEHENSDKLLQEHLNEWVRILRK